jgi:hypothetical protein
MIWHLKLKDDPDCYFVRRTDRGSVRFQGLSAKALDVARKEMAKKGFNLGKVIDAYAARPGRRS